MGSEKCKILAYIIWALLVPMVVRAADVTTVPELQALASRLLARHQGCIVALKPATGEILCMESHTLNGPIINRAVTGTYAPGSTFKVAQALVLFTEGIVDDDTRVDCHQGFTPPGGPHVGCHRHVTPLALPEAIGHSCNTFFCRSFMAMIDDNTRYASPWAAMNLWHDYMVSLGFGQRLGVDIRGEEPGILPDGSWLTARYGNDWTGKKVMYIGFGQGQITATPLQLCNLAALVANRGYYITPHLHPASVVANPEKYQERHYADIVPEAYDRVVRGMRGAVVYGTLKAINTPNWKICGKTGTVQNRGRDHSVTIAFAPMENPEIAVCAFIEHGGDGNAVAGPMAAQVINLYLSGQKWRRAGPDNHKQGSEKIAK